MIQKVYACGEGTNGRLGLGHSNNISSPRQITALAQYVVKKVSVHSGGKHAMALTLDGKVFSWGEGEDGKLGHNNRLSVDKPCLVEAFKSKRVRDIACGSNHSAAITSSGELYTWGLGEYGRLGHGDNITQLKPKLVSSRDNQEVPGADYTRVRRFQVQTTLESGGADYTRVRRFQVRTTLDSGGPRCDMCVFQVKGLLGVRVVQVACGSRDAQTLALSDEGMVFSWGDGDFGKLGRGGSDGCSTPHNVERLNNMGVCQIECGAQFSLALTRSGQVWTWGKGDYFRLGHGSEQHVRKPTVVEGLRGKKIIHVAVGALHCLSVTDTGQVYAWGDNDHGQQGNGTTTVNRKPALVHGLEDVHLNRVACGSSHSVAWSMYDPQPASRHEPVLFLTSTDPLGATVLGVNEAVSDDKAPGQKSSAPQGPGKKPSLSLSKMILSLESSGAKQHALQHVLNALQVLHARDAVVAALSSHASFTAGAKISATPDTPAEGAVSQASVGVGAVFEEGLEIAQGGGEAPASVAEVVGLSSHSTPESDHSPMAAFPSLSSSVSISSRASKMSASAMSVIAATMTSNAQVVGQPDETFPLQPNLDEFSGLLGQDDARMLVDLLKLAVAGRAVDMAKETIVNVLIAMGSANPDIRDMLVEHCVTELEDVTLNTHSIHLAPQPVVQESSHPYADDVSLSGHVKIPGAKGLRIEFDRQCSTERRHDPLAIMDGTGRCVSTRSGREWSDWSSEIRIPGEEMRWKFTSDGSVNGWGWKFTVYPLVTYCGPQERSSDRAILSQPSVELVMCLLDSRLNLSSDRILVTRLATALASCAQLSSLAAPQRMWALHKLRRLMVSRLGRLLDIPGLLKMEQTTDSALPALVKGLPQALLRQYEYEDPIVRSGKHLMHSDFFKVLVALACDLGLDSLPCCSENHKWSWFRRYCMAARVAGALVGRTTLPHSFCVEEEVYLHLRGKRERDRTFNPNIRALGGSPVCYEIDGGGRGVRKKISEMLNESGVLVLDHENHECFKQFHDEQLLLWLHRRPEDWTLSWNGSGTIYGWGHNHRGQLGGVEGAKVKLPTSCEALSALRPVQLVGGEQTLMAVTADGKVYATGYGAGGRLGIGGTDSVMMPTLIESIQHICIKKVAVNSGGKHCLALTAEGEVYSWGEGDDGKLGHGSRRHFELEVVGPVCSRYLVCGLSQDDSLIAECSCERPRLVEMLKGKEIVDIACGGAHSAAITAKREVYTWGKGRYGRLGHGDSEDQLKPKLVGIQRHWSLNISVCCSEQVEALLGSRVMDIACGSGDAQTLCITDDDNVWSWGDGDYGKLGRGGSDGCKVPMKIESLAGLGVIKVECGSQFSVALTRSGSVYTWGKGDYHRLGHGTDDHVRRPRKVAALQGKKIICIATGFEGKLEIHKILDPIHLWYRLTDRGVSVGELTQDPSGSVLFLSGSLHCVACSDQGEVYTWGDNDEGQLGDGTTNAIQRPRPVVALQAKKISHVACGSAHTLAWSTTKPVSATRLPPGAPLEYDLVRDMPLVVLRNRLVLLHHFSELFCPVTAMFPVEGEGSLDTLRGILVSSTKEATFRKVVQATMVRDRQHGPVIELNRIQVKRARGKGGLAGPDGIKSVLGQMVSKMSLLTQEALFLPHRVWKVKFVGQSSLLYSALRDKTSSRATLVCRCWGGRSSLPGESVDDCGGGYSESITEMCEELTERGSAPSHSNPQREGRGGDQQGLLLAQPHDQVSAAPQHVPFLGVGRQVDVDVDVAGVLMGIAIRTGSPLSLNLAEPVWKQLAGMTLTPADLTEVDRDYVPGLLCIRDMEPDDKVFHTLEMPFSTPSAYGNDVPLSTRYRRIMPENRLEYVKLALNYRLHEFDEQVKAVKEGMARVVPVPLVSLFSGYELQTMVCGSPDIPLALLKSVATYKGVEASSPLVQWFWDVMEEFTNQERSLFLRFVWGRTRLPRTIADFRGRDFVLQVTTLFLYFLLYIQTGSGQVQSRGPLPAVVLTNDCLFQVLDKYNPADHFLPESYTCFFLLKMPRYSCKAVLQEKLKYAIHFCKSIDTDEYARVAMPGSGAASSNCDSDDVDSIASDQLGSFL
uniref:HECT domain-containing protein n=1 Tax=Timema bartmani TaxID=61472 RepID=A0A7R9F3C1_9NEOP|nr:unnamed protein product [Timema bartmani]